MSLEVYGPHPFERDATGRQRTRIGTLFLKQRVLFTAPPGVHAQQRAGFLELLNERRAAQGRPALTKEEQEAVCTESVDLIFDPDEILIRPNPDRMDLAFAADEQLCELTSKRRVKFLMVCDARIRESIKERGECWRLSSVPKARAGKGALILQSKVAIQNQPIYFYNRNVGTRYLTFDEFDRLEGLEPEPLARQLQEIADYAGRRNRIGRPELAFFAADLRPFGAKQFADVTYPQLSPERLRSAYDELRGYFRSAVHEAFRKDDPGHKPWLERMIEALVLEGCDFQTEQVTGGFGPEFFLQIEWLPGGRFEEGEFLPDSIFEEAAAYPQDAELQRLCEPSAKGIIFNLIREYGDLEYINVGRLPESLSIDRPQSRGRRGVYMVLCKSRGQLQPTRRFIRLQKFGVWERLDEGTDLLQAMEDSEEYTDYWLDRRLGCRQLGMNLTSRVTVRRLAEVYLGRNAQFRGRTIHTTYFEREYLDGLATDKLPPEKLARPEYTERFARLLGAAAASSLIVGRSLDLGSRPVFDDGDEVVIEDADGLPSGIFIGDHSGAFGEYKKPLEMYAEHYAQPVYRRAKFLRDPRVLAEFYLEALRDQFLHIQGDYRKRRRAFDTLFKHCRYDTGGSFAYRWECVLKRLDATDADKLVQAIRDRIWLLKEQKAA